MEAQTTELNNILTHWKHDKSNLIEMLQDIQERYRHIPPQIANTLAEELDVPLKRIFHIATFYKGFSLKPRGKHTICVCTGTACHVKGGTRILENIKRELSVEEGGTTDDLLFSLESVRCVGCCGLAPVVTVDGEVYGDTSSVKVKKILDKQRKNERAL
jgi:NADH:ubiquinone oxidoreductase subunit E